jgi:hypothetical protein
MISGYIIQFVAKHAAVPSGTEPPTALRLLDAGRILIPPPTYSSDRWMGYILFPLTPAPPRPSPLGRGRIVRRLSAIPATEFAKPVCAKHTPAVCCSLSPRERVRVGETTVRQPPVVAYPRDSSVRSSAKRNAAFTLQHGAMLTPHGCPRARSDHERTPPAWRGGLDCAGGRCG